MRRAAIYARYSSERQRDVSIDDQVRVCREFCEREGYHVAEVYADRAISGRSTDKRVQFKQMIAEAGEYDAIVVYKMDRFARNRYHSAIYKEELKEKGVRLISATELIPEGADGILLESLIEAMAEYYSINLSQNIRRGLEGNAIKCHHNGVHTYGYTLEKDGSYGINSEEAAVVRLIFEHYIAGASMKEIAQELAPFRTRRGKPFTVAGISRMIQNDRYAGVYRFKDHVVPGGMPAIVSTEEYEEAQRRRTRRMRSRNHDEDVDYILTGKLYDPEGRPFVGVSGKNKIGRKYCYYKCKPTGQAWRKYEVEEAAARAVRQLLAAPGARDVIYEMVESGAKKANASLIDAVEETRARIEEIDRERDKLYELAMKVRDTSHIVDKINGLDEEQEGLRDNLAEMERSAVFITREHLDFFLDKATRLESPKIIAALIDHVILYEDGTLRVHFTLKEDERGKISHEWEGEGPAYQTGVRLGSHEVHQMYSGRTLNGIYVYPIPWGFGILTSVRK